jgi:hypothetical protein
MDRVRAVFGAAAAILLSSACTSLPAEPAPQEHLDERTGATLTVADQPLTFARDRSERAANLRDYLTLVASSVNRGGKISFVFITYAWSTLDVRDAGAGSREQLIVTADDRRMKLQPAAADPLEAGLSLPLQAPPGVQTISRVYAVDLDTLRFLANSRSLRLQTSDDEDAPYYELWHDTRGALRAFVRYADGDRF